MKGVGAFGLIITLSSKSFSHPWLCAVLSFVTAYSLAQ